MRVAWPPFSGICGAGGGSSCSPYRWVQPCWDCSSYGSFLRAICPTPRRCSPMNRSEEHTSELQSLMRISYAVFCLKKKKRIKPKQQIRLRSYSYNYILHDHNCSRQSISQYSRSYNHTIV